MGGATAKIGDPSGRTTERDVLRDSLIDQNLIGIKRNIETIFQNHEELFWDKSIGHLKPPMYDKSNYYTKCYLMILSI